MKKLKTINYKNFSICIVSRCYIHGKDGSVGSTETLLEAFKLIDYLDKSELGFVEYADEDF